MMRNKIKQLINRTPLIYRRFILICIDTLIIYNIINLSLFLSKNKNQVDTKIFFNDQVIGICVFFLITSYLLFGKYKGLTRYVNSRFLYKLTLINSIVLSLFFLINYLLNDNTIEANLWILSIIIINFSTAITTFLTRDILRFIIEPKYLKKINIIIYGAGSAGAKLSELISSESNNNIITFIDDNKSLWGRTINGISINPPKYIHKIKNNISTILLAIPSLNPRNRRDILNNLQYFDIPVMQIPSLEEIISGANQINKLRPIQFEDLLGRSIVEPDLKLLKKVVENETICVTGAGGSIGSVLCEQIIKLKPKNLFIIENSEPSLYRIQQKLDSYLYKEKVTCILGNVTDFYFLDNLISKKGIQVIFHAAAYKHVPIVEANPIQGMFNNIFSTEAICKAAFKNNIKQLVMVSTDKAVRPTNIMGASKRLCELIVQAFANEQKLIPGKKTLFSMVRFGNVIGSSGSVVPLFQRQIAKGGPVTITSPDMVRYFMSINEAVQLILQSSSLAKGGDIFLLDMGEPQNIKNLASQMIKLSGLSLKSDTNPNGNIEIVCTGLRPGEKMFEEVLIDAESLSTEHPLIYRAIEKSINSEELSPKLEKFKGYLEKYDLQNSILLLSELVPEWQISEDILYREEKNNIC